MRSAQRSTSSRRYTWDDFVALADEDQRELVDGELVEVEVPTKWHENVVMLLGFFLTAWARTRRRRVLASGYKVRIRSDCGAMPDVQMLKESTYRASGNDQGLVDGKPEVAIEIISPSSRRHDRVRKVAWYASIGVPEYWIVDVDDRIVQRLVLRAGAYVLKQQAAGDDVFRPTSMRGLAIPLAEIWDAVTPAKKKAGKRAPKSKR
jgi:Uma2 family endonuclease